MARYPKIRILVGNKERFVELLSLQERPDGTVIIVPKSGYRIITDGQRSKIESEHISLHASNLSSGTTINTTINSENGTMHSSAFIEDSKIDLVWPVFTRSVADLESVDYDYSHNRESERKIVLFERINSYCSVLYSVFAQRKGSSFPEIDHFSLTAIEFSQFTVGIYVTNLHVPPTLSSFRSTLVTGHNSLNKEIGVIKSERGALSFSISQLENVLSLCCEQVARMQTRTYLQEFAFDSPIFSGFIEELLTRGGAIISKEPYDAIYHPSPRSKFIPWICHLAQVDDSKEFNRALRKIFISSKPYKYVFDSFSGYKRQEMNGSKFPFDAKVLLTLMKRNP